MATSPTALSGAVGDIYGSLYLPALGVSAHWDGTNWLGPMVYLPPSGGVTTISPTGAFSFYPVDSGYPIKLVRWTVCYKTGATHNGTNYWTIGLDTVEADFTNVALGTVSTATDSALTFYRKTVSTFIVNPLAATVAGLRLTATKTAGAPDDMAYWMSAIRVQDILG